MTDYLLRNVKIAGGHNKGTRDIAILDGIIGPVTPAGTGIALDRSEIIDCKGLLAISAPMDNHVHFREPGSVAYKEGWDSGSLSALYGGLTAVVEVQNNPPFCDTPEALAKKRNSVDGRSSVNFGFYANVLASNIGILARCAPLCLGYKLFMGHSTGNLGVGEASVWLNAAEVAADTGLPLVVHAEDPALFSTSEKSTDHNRNRPPEAEASAVRHAIDLSRKTGAAVHIFHISCAEAVQLVAWAKDEGLAVTCAVCPHHLVFTDEDALRTPSLLKVNPPIRPRNHVKALRKALENGTIDVFQTDHAPHLKSEKSLAYETAPAGLPGVEFLLSWGIEFCLKKRITFERLEQLVCVNPRKLHGLPPVAIETGEKAEFSLFDIDGPFTVTEERTVSKSNWTPYEGMILRGTARYVFLNGVMTLNCGFADGKPRGAFLAKW